MARSRLLLRLALALCLGATSGVTVSAKGAEAGCFGVSIYPSLRTSAGAVPKMWTPGQEASLDAIITTFTFGIASAARPVINGLKAEAIASGHPGAPLAWSLGGLYTVPELVQLPELLNSEMW